MATAIVARESNFLNHLHRIQSTRAYQSLIRRATPQQIQALEEIIENILHNGRITTDRFKKRLRPKARFFREFVHKKTPLKRKKRLLNQQGSGLRNTIKQVIPALRKGGLILSQTRNNIPYWKRMAKRMVLVPEEQQALAYQQKQSITPQLRSIANIDALMNYLLYSSKLPSKRRMRLYNQLNIQKQNISRQFGDVGIAPSMQIAQARLPAPTRQTLVGHEEPMPRPIPNLGQAPGRALLPPGTPFRRSRSLTRASSRAAPRLRTRSLSAPRRPTGPPPQPPPAQIAPVPPPIPPPPPPASQDTIQRTRKRKRARPSFKLGPTPMTRSRSKTLAIDPRSLAADWTRLRRKK